ncbi:MAG: hypothetical protein E7421_00390 [Ruminococcaceae bacterium]|nr:hypothetical protein [Oscillospiraceae bacterium]
MEKISFDSGVKSYKINGAGVLRFNPGDPNVYARFLEAADKLQDVENALVEEAKKLPEADGTGVVQLLARADKEMKQVLSWVFGEGNDFDKILGGVNLLAVADNGQRVVTNLLAALQPVLVEGAERCAKEKVDAAVLKAKARRGEQR